MVRKTYKITEIDANQRIDKYIKKVLPLAPAGFIYKLFRKKDIKINNFSAFPGSILKEGDEVMIFITDEQLNSFSREYYFAKMPLTADIIYEDDAILVLDKPRGILVHSTIFAKKDTLTNQVLTYLEEKGQFDPKNRGYIPSPVNRIDQQTSGIIIFAKTLTAAQALGKTFQDCNNITRKYLAICSGKVQKSGVINLPLRKEELEYGSEVTVDEEGKEAITKYKAIKYFNNLSLVAIEILTGRTNQIRVHMARINHPILGDTKYGDSLLNDFLDVRQLCLHCHEIQIKNIDERFEYLKKVKLVAPMPEDFNKILARLD